MKAIMKSMSILLSVMMIIGVFTIVPFSASALEGVPYINRQWDWDENEIYDGIGTAYS